VQVLLLQMFDLQARNKQHRVAHSIQEPGSGVQEACVS
jgi:hypothetical protein